MKKKTPLVLVVMFFFLYCGPLVLIPPEVDLIPFERVGLITFSLENAEGRIDELATQRFLQEITYYQRGVQIIELGTIEDVLAKIDMPAMGQEAALAIGEQFNVTSFFYGMVSVSDVKPQINITSLVKSMSVQAVFSISATARFLSAETGATLWTDSVHMKDSLAYLSMEQGGIPYFDVRDQDSVYTELIDDLMHVLSRDFRPTRKRL